MKLEDFKIGMRVWIIEIDEDNIQKISGTVQDIAQENVFIKWDDLTDEIKHDANEFELIHEEKT